MSEVLSNLSHALAAVVEKASPWIVRVDGRSRLPTSGIIWDAEGVIVTASHGLERDTGIKIGFADGRELTADLVGRDIGTDIAVLKVEVSGLTRASWSNTEYLKVGHLVLALGRPGREIQATMGMISQLGPQWRTPTGATIEHYLQTDLTMYPGFSGGALVDAEAQVVGVNTSAFSRGDCLTITPLSLRTIVEALIAHGRIPRGYLGVGAQPTRLPDSMAVRAGQKTGLLLTSVEPGSPAEAGGLFLGDTLISVDGQPIRHLDDLLAVLTGEKVGADAELRILRGGRLQSVLVTIGMHP